MKVICKFLIVVMFVAAVPSYGNSDKQQNSRTKLHSTTDWRIEPSFKFDALCFLGVLTGDPFYVDYYKNEYAEFERQLTPAAGSGSV